MSSEVIDKDLEMAKKLAQQWEEEELKAAAAASNKNIHSSEDKNAKQTQAELDALLAAQLMKEEEEAAAKLKEEAKKKYSAPVYSGGSAGNDAYGRKLMVPNACPPTKSAIKRITHDLTAIFRNPNPTIHVMPDDEDITRVEALVIGPDDTPYAGGFFHFSMIFPHDYPWHSPKVLFRTTDQGRVRFNPNLYKNGKVCLSLLGTWSGQPWSAVQTCMSLLLSIQSLLSPVPYHNEPGFEKERRPGDIQAYNECIEHETLRTAVIGMMERPTCDDKFWPVQCTIFKNQYKSYRRRILDNMSKDGQYMRDPFGDKRGIFQYKKLLEQLDEIERKLRISESYPLSSATLGTHVESSESPSPSNQKNLESSLVPTSEEVKTSATPPTPAEN